MKTITRYIIREVTPPFFVGVIFFTFVFVIELIARMVKIVIEKNAPLHLALEFLSYIVLDQIALTIPMAVLMASIMAFGRFSADNEIVAMKASGLNSFNIYVPIVIFGLMIFLGLLAFQEYHLPIIRYRSRVMLQYIVNIKPSVMLQRNTFAVLPKSKQSIAAREVLDNRIYDVIIFEGQQDVKKTLITAEVGEWYNNEDNARYINLVLRNGAFQEMDSTNLDTLTLTPFKELSINIVRDVKDNVAGEPRSYREISISELGRRLRTLREEGKDVPENEAIELQRKYAVPTACIIFVILGSILGTFSKRSGKGVGFGISALIIFVFYALTIISETALRDKIPPAMTPWVPNIVLGAFAVFSFIRSFAAEGK